jgi:phosphoribosylanthranilate isomerase
MRTRIKVCGVTRVEDAQMAAEAGVDAIGVILTESPRRVSVETASRIRAALPEDVAVVAVFAEESPEAALPQARDAGAGVVQVAGWLGQEIDPSLDVWHVIRGATLPDPADLSMIPLHTYLLDAHAPDKAGGTGLVADWSWAKRCVDLGRRLIVAGGLNAQNVAPLIAEVRPFGVDASSGLELDVGRKDPAKVRAFVSRIREADHARPKRS